MAASRWSAADIPDQSGRVAIVTGGNSGIGFETAAALAAKGAHVVLACRDAGRAKGALEAIRARHAGASLEVQALDLASLASVRAFADRVLADHARLDLLLNNAGVMAIPRRTTADGFEMQLGTNHLGHFALTGLLSERLLQAPAARVVTVSSSAHRPGRIDWEDLQRERGYTKWGAYAQSKLANLLFAYELDRRLRRRGANAQSNAAHPGYAATNLQFVGARMENDRFTERLFAFGNRLLGQSAAMGALPTLYAATSPDVASGDFIGPSQMFEAWGPPKKVGSSRRSHDEQDARRLWELSEQLTGVRTPGLP
jgi:NAD(P)-dependent dehydrogenase (short-subunit alcohol dehydrogenase family)